MPLMVHISLRLGKYETERISNYIHAFLDYDPIFLYLTCFFNFEKELIFTAPFLAVSTYLIGFSATQRNDDTDGTFLSMFSANLGL